MGGDGSDNWSSTSPSGDLQQDGDSQAPRDGTEAASKEAPLEDSSKETPSFASKEALENSSKETAMAGMETATASMEAPDSASSGQASKQAAASRKKIAKGIGGRYKNSRTPLAREGRVRYREGTLRNCCSRNREWCFGPYQS